MPEVTVLKEYNGIKIERFIKRILPEIPMSMIFRLLRKGKVRVNKRQVRNNYRLKEGDLVILHIPPDTFLGNRGDAPPRQGYLLSISDPVFENEDFIAIHKPPHIAVHGGEGHKENLLVDAVWSYLGYESSSLRFAPTPVHRLDIDTSGVLIFAKTYDFLREFNQLQRDRKVYKEYSGLVNGRLKKDRIVMETAVIRRDRPASRIAGKVGRTILSLVGISEKFIAEGMVLSLLKINIETGRTHQIRSHLFQSGLTLVGDRLYGNPAVNDWAKKRLGLKRQFLHASIIRFKYGGREFELYSPLSPDLSDALRILDIQNR